LKNIVKTRDEELLDLKLAMDSMGYTKDPKQMKRTREKLSRSLKKTKDDIMSKRSIIFLDNK